MEMAFDDTWKTPSVFIACNELEAARIQDAGVLKPAVFEHCPSMNFFKLFQTEEAAMMDGALRAFTGSAVKSATEDTVWFVLKLQLTDHQWLQLLLNDEAKTQIMRGPGSLWKQFQVGGELPLKDVAKEWMTLTLAPIGFGTWAEKRLSNYKQWPDMTCGDCGKEHVTVWLGSKRHAERHSETGPERKGYCAECWHKYYMTKFP